MVIHDKGDTGMAWEYKIVQGPKERHLNRIITEDELARFDKQGWELVSAFATQRGIVGKGSQDNEHIYYIFRRPRKRETPPAK
jgi:hypothetical protein